MTEAPVIRPVNRALAERVATLAGSVLLLYLLLVFGLDATVGPIRLTLTRVLLLWLLAAAGLRAGTRRATGRGTGSPDRLLGVGLLSAALLLSVVTIDLLTSAYLALTSPPTNVAHLTRNDRNIIVGELYPRTYYPSATKNYRIHKPNVTITGSHYGGYYLSEMLRSATLRDSVLDRRHLTIRINDLGFRDASRADSCETLALGDSFTFGWGVTEGRTWTDLLEPAGGCVYNLGVNDASPGQELQLLEDLLSRSGQRPPRRVVWALYEGNDLEDSFYPGNPTAGDDQFVRATQGTIVWALRDFLYNVRSESLIHRLRTGEFRLMSPASRARRAGHYAVDGVPLVTPLFHSPAFGYLLADAQLLDRLSRPKAYTTGHRHRRQLDQAFERMRHLADSLGFEVSVAIIPTAARLYAPYFELMPAPSAEPYLVDYFAQLARANGFDVIDLLEEMTPYAKSELLYFRDDDHLNERGHAVMAEILAKRLHPAPAPGQGSAPGGRDPA